MFDFDIVTLTSLLVTISVPIGFYTFIKRREEVEKKRDQEFEDGMKDLFNKLLKLKRV